MRFPFFVSSAAVALVCAIPQPLGAQTFAANTGTESVISPVDANRPKVTVPGHHPQNEDALIYGRVRDGVYTVDGMVAKLKLNYDVDGTRFLYMFVPGVGTAVISLEADHDAVTTEAKLKDNELRFTAGDHRFLLTGVALVNSKGSAPAHLFVKLDRTAWSLERQPMIGFGNASAVPYVWPGALPPQAATAESTEPHAIPPVPAALLPSTRAVTPKVKPVSLYPSTLGSALLR